MNTSNKKIRLLAADDHPLIRKGFEHLFSYQTDLELLAVLSNGKELLDAVETFKPDIVVTP